MFASSCGQEPIRPERNIVREFGTDGSLSYSYVDTNRIEAVVELSSQAVKCKILSIQDVVYTNAHDFCFYYEAEIEEIFLDTTNALNVGDIIIVSSNEGYLLACDAAELVGDNERSRKLGILRGEYGDNDYILSSNYSAIPIELDRSYFMYLTDKYFENEGVYAEIGKSFLYEVWNGKVYWGSDFTEVASENEFSNIMVSNVANRTGRADLIGESAYLDELVTAQQAEARAKLDN